MPSWVIGPVVCTVKHPAYEGRIYASSAPLTTPTIRDRRGLRRGGRWDTVITGGAPGLPRVCLTLTKPHQDVIMGIVD